VTAQTTRPSYYLFRRRPVKILPGPGGEAALWWLDLRTGAWVQDPDLVREIADGDRAEQPAPLTPHQFVDVVEAMRAARLTGDGPVFALYETINAVYAIAEAEQRRLTPEEMALLAGLRPRTYRMFEEELASQGNPAAQPDLAD